ncbi:MAG: hypothetical protein H6766_06290 [Candidatus Peribacteria bacterium]|nr:MAG: hypothetical protein H6766_06290 [Candidatus Peribacteria bacterium]
MPGEDNSSDMLTIAYVGGGSERDTIYINQKTNLTENALIHEMAHTIRAEKVLYDDCINLSDRHKIIGAHAFNILIEKPQ